MICCENISMIMYIYIYFKITYISNEHFIIVNSRVERLVRLLLMHRALNSMNYEEDALSHNQLSL